MSESMHDYKSPIEVFIGKVQEKIENEVITAVQNVGIKVNKEELQKALVYDRRQYELGYEQGKWDAQRHGHWELIDSEEPRRYGCSKCKRLVFYLENYCPNCGAKMDGVEE